MPLVVVAGVMLTAIFFARFYDTPSAHAGQIPGVAGRTSALLRISSLAPIDLQTAAPAPQTADRPEDRPIKGWRLLWTLLGVFAGGLALNLTPCVYPLIPVTVSYFGVQNDRSSMRAALHGACYILGLSLTNSILGLTAAWTGSLLGAALQNPAVLMVIAAVLIGLAASLFGLWELRLPFGLTQMAARPRIGLLGSLSMGLTMGVVAAPCIGPFVLGLLTWVAGMGNPLLGFGVFFILSLGLGLPLFALALLAGKIQNLPRSGRWMVWVRDLMGWVLVAMALFYLRALLPKGVHAFLFAGALVVAGLHLGWKARFASNATAFKWPQAVVGSLAGAGAVLIIGGWLLQSPGIAWQPYTGELLSAARQSRRPVIIDFHADWCTECVALDQRTFHDPSVVALSRDKFVMLRIDLSRGGSPQQEALLRSWAVRGVPTVIFIGPDGAERRDLRLVEFTPPSGMLSRMEALHNAF